jgi:hypothetical protein
MTQFILALGNLGGKFVCPVLLGALLRRIRNLLPAILLRYLSPAVEHGDSGVELWEAQRGARQCRQPKRPLYHPSLQTVSLQQNRVASAARGETSGCKCGGGSDGRAPRLDPMPGRFRRGGSRHAPRCARPQSAALYGGRAGLRQESSPTKPHDHPWSITTSTTTTTPYASSDHL